jgi:HAD superfamily hydrolase (TIGR01490 family)
MLDAVEAAFFDLDKTVIAKASMVAFGRPLYRAGMISRWLVVRALWGQLLFQTFGADEERMRKVRESALRVTRGWEQAKINAIVRDTLIDVIEPIVYDEALDLIRYHQTHGRRVFIISASPEEIVAPLARYLEVDEAIATRAMLDDEGRYTGDVEFYAYGPYKAEAIAEIAELEGIDLDASYAYSDSATDVPMLEMVGHPVAVNPDRELARVARQRDWEIRHFEHGVPLRERVALPPPGKALAVGGAALTTAAIAGALWWLVSRRTAPPPPMPPSTRERLAERARAAANLASTRGRGPGATRR